MSVHGAFEDKLGIVQESTFGTAIADDQNFILLDADIPQWDSGAYEDIRQTNRESRVLESADLYITEKGGTRIIPINNCVPNKLDIAEFLYAVIQNVTEGASTPFTKVFTWDGSGGTATTQPDFSSDAGAFYTIGIDDKHTGAYDKKFTSCICRQLGITLDFSPGADGRPKINSEWISGFAVADTSTFSGTWAYNTRSFLDFLAPSIKQLNNADIIVYGFEINFINNAVRVGNDSSGNAEDYKLGPYECSGSITLRWDANTVGTYADYLAGTEREIDIAVGTGGADGHLSFLIPNARIQGAPQKNYEPEQGQTVTLNWMAVHDGTNPIVTVTLSDANDQGW